MDRTKKRLLRRGEMELKTKGKLGKSSGETETANGIYKRTDIFLHTKVKLKFIITKKK